LLKRVSHPAAELIMRQIDMATAHGHFAWYELATSDVVAAKAFYADLLGWEATDTPISRMAYTLCTTAKRPVCGLLQLNEEARRLGLRPSWTGYIGVNDVDTTVDRVKQLGGAIYVPPRDMANVSRFSVIADPQEATLALLKWLQPRLDQTTEPAAPGRVGWHELLAADWEKVWAFYGALFGWQKALTDTDVMGTYQVFSVGGRMIGGMFTKPPTVPTPFWLYYFNVGDIGAAAKRVIASGGQVINGPIEVPDGNWVVQCTDPQGAIFGLLGKRRYKRVTIAGPGGLHKGQARALP